MGAVLLQTNNTSFMEQKILRVIFCVKRALKKKKRKTSYKVFLCVQTSHYNTVLQELNDARSVGKE